MKNIAILVNSLRFGGAEVQTVELANNLANRNFNVMLFSFGSEDAIRNRISEKINVVMLGKKRYLDLKVLKKLVAKLREFEPEGMIMANSYSTMYGYLARVLLGRNIKMVSVQHTTLMKGLADGVKNTLYRRIINRMDRVVFVCNTQKEHWISKYKIKPEISDVIYNGIDINRFTGFQSDGDVLRRQLGFTPWDIVIGINANLRPEKKHEDMIEAVKQLNNCGYPVKLLIIGDGVRRGHIEEFIRAKGMENHVTITGFLQDVRPYLSIVDISALTSVAVETLSIAILESMALGKPVVLSDIGGARELVDQGENGLVYEAGNIEALVKSIKYIIDNSLFEPMGNKSREKAVKHFGKDAMVNRYVEVLKGA